MEKNVEEEKLFPPASFSSFPFSPYDVQINFMKSLYDAIENGKLGIFESPTGTGKSLSIICGSLSWLKDHETRKENDLLSKISKLKGAKDTLTRRVQEDWIQQQAEEMTLSNRIDELRIELEKMKLKSEKLKNLRNKKSLLSVKSPGIYKHATKTDKTDKTDEIDKTDQEASSESPNKDEDQDLALENSDCEEEEQEEASEFEDNAEYECTKILYLTRTHSQIQQFVKEIKKTVYLKEIRLVPLASRTNYCNNKEVQKLKSASLINQRCLDMQKTTKKVTTSCDKHGQPKKKTKCSNSCPYLTHSRVETLRDHILCELGDVEDIVAEGSKLSACSYYSARAAIKDAHMVVMPYQTLLHKPTRDAYGLKIQGNVVIIDEAHNLLEAIAAIYSAYVNGKQLSDTLSVLNTYKNRFESRFKPDNLNMLCEIITLVSNLLKLLENKSAVFATTSGRDQTAQAFELFTINDFMNLADVAHINIFKLLAFIEEKKLSQKLQGYIDRFYVVDRNPAPVREKGPKAFLKYMAEKRSPRPPCPVKTVPEIVFTGNPVLEVVHFFESLTNMNENGRVILGCEGKAANCTIKYIVLNPSSYFEDIVKEARSVIVAGGTMQPFEEFVEQLYVSAGGCRSRIAEFSCGHIIPKENVLPVAVSVGPTGQTFRFNYQNRSSPEMLNELGRLLINTCNVVPAGVVCFFSSYEYEHLVYNHFVKEGIIAKLEQKKQVVIEVKGSGLAEQLLKTYESAVYATKRKNSSQNGALLFSIIGGKLSEGLNFSDDLGRCVIVVGLPYASIKSPELAEKMKHLEAKKTGLGRQLYENLCMKAVNQSIGRAVRHYKDYSSILLVDDRFLQGHVQNHLPSWIRTSLKTCTTFGPVVGELAKFFRVHRTVQA